METLPLRERHGIIEIADLTFANLNVRSFLLRAVANIEHAFVSLNC